MIYRSPTTSQIQPIPLKGDRARTRFIIGLERTVEFQVFSLTNPNRVFVELPDVMLQLPPQPGGAAVGLVKSFRGAASRIPGKAAPSMSNSRSMRLVSDTSRLGSTPHR